MASGTITGVSEGADGGGGDVRVKGKERWSENRKVYTRRSFKGLKNNTNSTAATMNDTESNIQTSSIAVVNSVATATDTEPISVPTVVTANTDGIAAVTTAATANIIENTTEISNNVVFEPPSQEPAAEPDNFRQKQPISPLGLASDVSHSLDPAPPVASSNGIVKQGTSKSENRVKINLASKSKQDLRDLRRELENELTMVRGLVRRIEAKERPVSAYPNNNFIAKERSVSAYHNNFTAKDGFSNGGANRVQSEVVPIIVPRLPSKPFHQLSISVSENNRGMFDNFEKEKRTPKENQFYNKSEFLLANDKFPPEKSKKKSKSSGKKSGDGEMGTKFNKKCSALLERLMKHKHGWIFNEPVDAGSLGLIDYFTIIKHPMDLGTIKSRLSSNWYKSPKEFAEDVRLTFRNAMVYNPVGQDVHTIAGQLAKIFEDKWIVIEAEYNRYLRFVLDYDVGLNTPSSRRDLPQQPFMPHFNTRKVFDRSESMTLSSRNPPALTKPKAKDPNKRDMTYEEKQKLSKNLQDLPHEKLDSIVQIVRKRNSAVSQNDDEIEVDIDSVDNETLWELDRLVMNYKKGLSKNKRKAELALQARAEAMQNVQEKQIPSSVTAHEPQDFTTAKKKLHVEEVKQGENATRSSSSSSSSSSDSDSSSSDSDSSSSSSDDSDVGHSPKT